MRFLNALKRQGHSGFLMPRTRSVYLVGRKQLFVILWWRVGAKLSCFRCRNPSSLANRTFEYLRKCFLNRLGNRCSLMGKLGRLPYWLTCLKSLNWTNLLVHCGWKRNIHQWQVTISQYLCTWGHFCSPSFVCCHLWISATQRQFCPQAQHTHTLTKSQTRFLYLNQPAFNQCT